MTPLFDQQSVALTDDEQRALIPGYMQLNEFPYTESAREFGSVYTDSMSLHSLSRFSYILEGRIALRSGTIDLEMFMTIGEPGSTSVVTMTVSPVEQYMTLAKQSAFTDGTLYVIDGTGTDCAPYEELQSRIEADGGVLVVFYPDPIPEDDA